MRLLSTLFSGIVFILILSASPADAQNENLRQDPSNLTAPPEEAQGEIPEFDPFNLSAPPGNAQEKPRGFDPLPLKPVDTSSPRDTLYNFLANMDQTITAWRENDFKPLDKRAALETMGMLDFSTTPNRGAWSVQVRHILYLKEILDRVALPPANKIPGDQDVDSTGVMQWTIPDTRITISRVKDGPQKGEFLFSAQTVESLSQFYWQTRDLPYRREVATDFYKEYFDSELTALARERQLRNRLRKNDTSTPRATLQGFLTSIDIAYKLVMDADEALKAKPPTMTIKEALELEARAKNLLERAMGTLDLSQIPKAHREDRGIETALLLKEVLDRTLLPRLESVPDAQMIEAAQQSKSQMLSGSPGPFRWIYPNTEIEIVEIKEGKDQGHFLFSAETVAQAKAFYTKVRDLPYRSISPGLNEPFVDSRWARESTGFYDYYISTPGFLVPGTTPLGRIVDRLPSDFKVMYGDQTLWQWLALALSLAAVVLLAYLSLRLIRTLAERMKPPLSGWVKILPPVVIASTVILANDFIDDGLNLSGEMLTVVTTGSRAVVAIMAVWAVFRTCQAVAETIIAKPLVHDTSTDANLFRLSSRIIGFLAGGWILIVSLRALGADMIPLLAGLGVGGLAVALAAQRTFANFIGCLILYANKPVKVGDFCRYGDQVGTVEHIGLLSTQIRSLERTIITVPNAEFSEMKLDNFGKRDQRLLKTTLQLRYETTSEQMRYILAKLRELLLSHPKVYPEPARVRFVNYGEYSKDIDIFAYLTCREQNTFLAIQEDLLLRMEEIINEAGSGFAFPSQTAYLGRDMGTDDKQREAAEAEVEKWRQDGKLPFPEYEDEERERLLDNLDYPPKGSPGHKP